tara:strand:- start:1040 stop:1195 length:156 start_codon:yes stop_codon:yes gene_type:complete
MAFTAKFFKHQKNHMQFIKTYIHGSKSTLPAFFDANFLASSWMFCIFENAD